MHVFPLDGLMPLRLLVASMRSKALLAPAARQALMSITLHDAATWSAGSLHGESGLTAVGAHDTALARRPIMYQYEDVEAAGAAAMAHPVKLGTVQPISMTSSC